MARTKQTPRQSTEGKFPCQQQVSKEAPATARVKKSHTYKPLTALREIKIYQKSTEILLRKPEFLRLVIETTLNVTTDLVLDKSALLALYEAGKAYLVQLKPSDAYILRLIKDIFYIYEPKRITPKDIQLARRIRGERA